MDVKSNKWISREATIGPGIDSYYEYLLKVCVLWRQITNTDARVTPGVVDRLLIILECGIDSYYGYLLKGVCLVVPF